MRSIAMLAAAAVCALAAAQSPDRAEPDGRALFQKMQRALGGADRIAAIADYEEHVRAESWNGNTGRSMGEVRKRTRFVRPAYLRVDQVGPGSTYVLYFDGTAGWEILPGTDKVIPLEGGELTFAREYVRGFMLNTWLADRDPRYRITAPSPNVVRIADGDPTHQLDVTLDAASFLPTTLHQTSLSDPAHPVASDQVMTEWETVEGIRFARRFTVLRSGVRVAEALDARHTINTGLKPADMAVKPPDMKPVLTGADR
jgi:hypothetical protein